MKSSRRNKFWQWFTLHTNAHTERISSSGDEVITPGFTYIATAETVAVLGAKPVYVDIDPKTYNLCPEALAR